MSDLQDVLDDPIEGIAPPAKVVVVPANPPITDLTPAQEQQMLNMWNASPSSPPDLKTITQTLFPGRPCDGRSIEARAVKKALSKHKLKVRTTAWTPDQMVQLSDDQRLFIDNNTKTMTAVEMARVLFNNNAISNLHGETRAVNAYIKSTLPHAPFMPGTSGDVPTKPYIPPKTVLEALDRVNEYIQPTLDKEKLTPPQRRNLTMLVGYLHTYRFMAQMNNYVSESDRRLAEDAFIRSTFDKPDLAQEEVDQYIEYANQVVTGFIVQRRSNQLQANLEEITTANDESLKISMSLVEAIGKASTEYHQCMVRQQKLLDDLKEKRSTRLSKQVKENASILNLIQVWKAEETRKELLVHAEREQRAVASEVENLSTMSDIKARIFGLTKEEIING